MSGRLGPPLGHLPGEWAEHAACKGEPADVFFPRHARHGRRGRDNSVYRTARSICAACPVRAECLTHAIAHDERHGMWGGHTPEERDVMPGERLGTRPTTCAVCGGLAWTKSGQRVLCHSCREVRHRDRNRAYIARKKQETSE